MISMKKNVLSATVKLETNTFVIGDPHTLDILRLIPRFSFSCSDPPHLGPNGQPRILTNKYALANVYIAIENGPFISVCILF